jgi:hypothetical protein
VMEGLVGEVVSDAGLRKCSSARGRLSMVDLSILMVCFLELAEKSRSDGLYCILCDGYSEAFHFSDDDLTRQHGVMSVP